MPSPDQPPVMPDLIRHQDTTLSIRRDLLSRQVRSYADNLTVQLQNLSRAHGAHSPEEFKRLAQEKKIPEQVVRQYKVLIARLSEVVRSGKIPDDAHAEILGAKLREARDLLGEHNVFGPEQITKAWNIDLDPEDIPPIPYSTEDLEKAKQLGEILILRIDKDQGGRPLTIQRLQELTDPLLKEQGQGTSIYPYDWYKTDPLFTHETPSLKWALISPDLLPNTTDKNYLEQTLSLKDYLKQHHLLTEEEESELDDKTIKTLKKQISSDNDWQQAAETLSNLKININHRRSAPEAVYDTLLRFLITGERPLPDRYDWTRSRSLGGDLVRSGCFKPGGLFVSRDVPRGRFDSLGACSSR